jgi:hypothetical protein
MQELACARAVLPNMANVVQKRIETIRHEARDAETMETQQDFGNLSMLIPTNCENDTGIQENPMALSDFMNGRIVKLLNGSSRTLYTRRILNQRYSSLFIMLTLFFFIQVELVSV